MSKRDDPVLQGTLALEIRNISTFMKDSGQSVTSPRQQVAGLRWLLEAYPQVVDDVTCLSCYLKCEQNAFKWSASLYGTFRIVTKNGGFGKEKNFPKWRLVGKEPLGDSWGWSKFITSNELQNPDSGFVVDDSVKILADFSVTDVCGVACNVFETVDALAADVKLKVGDRVFYANKGYLSVVSSVFRDMFALTKAAEDNTEMEEVELSDLNANEFMEFLGVVYPTRYSITDNNVIGLYRIADRFDVQRVIAECECHLLSANNVPWFDKLKLAVDLDRDDLRDHFISQMTCDEIVTVNQNEKKNQLGMYVLQALHDKHIRIHHP